MEITNETIILFVNEINVIQRNQGNILTQSGFQWLHEKNDRDNFNIENIREAVKQIPQYQEIVPRINKKVSSYSLKHVLEDYRRVTTKRYGYITDGDYIVAMLLLGYNYSVQGHACYFNTRVIENIKVYNIFRKSSYTFSWMCKREWSSYIECDICENLTDIKRQSIRRKELLSNDFYCNECKEATKLAAKQVLKKPLVDDCINNILQFL